MTTTIGVESDFDTGFAAVFDAYTNKYAYVHDCGYIVFSHTIPTGCLECRSNRRQALSNHGTWHQLFILHEGGVMTYYDASSGEREDRIIVGYDFTDQSVAGINLVCNGQTPKVLIDLGNAPIEIELITDSVTAISHLIDALYEARALLEEHQIQHATDNAAWTQEALYVPDDWTGGQQ